MGHRKILFKLLFQASSHTLLTLAKDERYLGGVGYHLSATYLPVRRTRLWQAGGQDLSFHPHVHCLVSGGGVKNQTWVAEKRRNNNFLFPKGAMQKIYKGFFMEQLRKLYKNNLLKMEESDFTDLLSTIGYKKWNVYAKKPFGGPHSR